MLKLITKTGKTVNTSARTCKGLISAWTSGAIDLTAEEFEGASIYKKSQKIAVITGIGWVEAK